MAPGDASCEYAVVGGGPAGAMAARTLAERGRDVVLIDWRPREEKPCGGGIPARGMVRFGGLLAGVPRNDVKSIHVVGPRGDEAAVSLAAPLAIFSRRDFDEALRERAREVGARREAARVTTVDPTRDGFQLTLRRRADGPHERLSARYVVAADGAAGAIRRRLLELAGTTPPPPDQFSRSHTLYPSHAPASEHELPRVKRDVMSIAYASSIDGYGWNFPRTDHASVGWCVQGSREDRRDLRSELAPWLGNDDEAGVGALIPSFRGAVVASNRVEGDRFALVGDAAGAVDPITREGIHHAMASGAALGDADPLARPGRYATWYDAELRPELVASARLAPRFFQPSFLTLMVRALDRSEALREVFRDLVAGTQSYAHLRGRLLRTLPRAFGPLCLAAVARRHFT